MAHLERLTDEARRIAVVVLVTVAAVAVWDAPGVVALSLAAAWLIARTLLSPVRPAVAGTPSRPTPATIAAASDRRLGWLPPAAGWLTGAVGVLNVASALTPELPGRLAALSQLASRHTIFLAHALVLPAGLALLVISPYLARRRRRALHVAVLLLGALGLLNLLKGLDVEEALASWMLAGLLVWGREAFRVRHPPLRAATALRYLAPPAVTAVGAGVAALVADLWSAPAITEAVAFAVGLVVARAAFRPLAAPTTPPPASERQEAHRLVRASGSDTLSFFKLRGDLQHLIAGDRRAFLSYRVEGGVLLCSGDPVGPEDAIPGLLREARRFAQVRGLKLGFVGGGERLRELAAGAGMRALYIGDEAIVEPARFSLEGRAIRKVRQSVSRLVKAGYTADIHTIDELADAELAELEAVAERWREGRPERGFSMAMDGLRGEGAGDCAVLVARDGTGGVRGFLHFVPSYGSPRASLSAMCRDHDVPNGLTEFMVVRAIEAFGERGIEELSLNFAAFGRLLHGPATVVERLLGRLVRLANPFFQIESLYSFNAKFTPVWRPRYLLYEGAFGLPRAALAALWAEGHLPKPALPAGLRRSTAR